MNLQTRRAFVATIAAGMLPATAPAAAAVPPRYRLTVLRPPSDEPFYAELLDINNVGQVLTVFGDQPFVWQRGVFTRLVPPARKLLVARAINDRGWITGNDAADERPAFLYRDGEYEFWPVGCGGGGEAINRDGVVAGSFSRTCEPDGSGFGAFVHRDGVSTFLPEAPGSKPIRARAINNRNQVVGTLAIGDLLPDETYAAYHAYVYQDGTVIDIHPATEGTRSYAEDINDKGQVVGELYLKARGSRAFVYRNGVITLIGPPAGPEYETGRAYAINESGVVVGLRTTGYDAGYHPFVYTGGRMYDLNSVTLWRRGFRLREARAINERGEIVGEGSYRGEGGSFPYLLRPIQGAAARG